MENGQVLTSIAELIKSNTTITNKQDKIDNALNTIDKTISGAINEINSKETTNETNINSHISNISNPHNTNLSQLKDIAITNPTDKQVISYDTATSKFINRDSCDEKVKMTSISTASKYLGEWIDGITIQNVGNKLICKSLDGQEISLLELNRLSGLDKNIMDYLNAISNPMTVRAVVNTYADLSTITTPVNGNVAIVKADENNSNKQWTYIYVDSTWNPLTENNVTVRDFFVDKLDLTSEVKNKLPQVNMDMTDIVKTTDLANYLKSDDASSTYATISQVGGKANSSDVDTLLANKVDKVANSSLMADSEITRLASVTNYDHTNVDNHMANNTIHVTSTDKTNLANVVASSHTHSNKTVIDKFSEVSGQPYYNGSAIGGGSGTGVTINDTSTSSTTETYSIDKIKSLISSVKGFEVVSSLPVSQISSDKIYILNNSDTYTMNYYDTSWHVLSGSGSNQILIGTTAPTDTSKLWLDITSIISPILKWYNGTDWISISGTVDTSTLLDKTTYKGSNDGIVKKADALTDLVSTSSQIDNTVNNAIIVDNSNRSNGKVITYNASLAKNEWANVNVTGVIGSSQLTNVGTGVTINNGAEVTFSHPSATDSKLMINIQEIVQGISVTDTHVDFSDGSKYIIQDNEQMLISNNKSQLNVYNKLLMHMNDSTFKDEYGQTVTNTGVVYNTSTYKFGTGSAYFNGSSYLSVTNSSDFNFGNGDFTIDFNVYLTNNTTQQYLLTYCAGGTQATSSFIVYILPSKTIGIATYYGSTEYDATNPTIINTNTWYHVAIIRSSSNLYVAINGVLGSPTAIGTNSMNSLSSNLIIGKYYNSTNYVSGGYIDDLRIAKGVAIWTSNFTPPITEHTIYSVNTPLYLKTTGLSNFSLSTVDTITSLTIPNTIPTNTSIKCLFSVDNYTNYLYYDGTSIQKFAGNLTSDWSSVSSTISQIQTLFTNLSMSNLTNMLSSLGITPINLDLIFQLNTTDITITPSISTITMVYTTGGHTEFASFGSYDESYPKFSIKRVNNSQLSIRNNTTKTRTINVNCVLGD